MKLSPNARFLQEKMEIKLEPSFEEKEAEHVLNGVALRNRNSGTIHLRGVPQQREVLRAILYWNFSDQNKEGRDSRSILINGNTSGAARSPTTTTPAGAWSATTPTGPT